MSALVISNVSTYRAISEDAYLRMQECAEAGRSSMVDGSGGWVIKYDPEHKCFKNAMISIVFMGVWLEAILHLKIVSQFDEEAYHKYDRDTYENKMKHLGFSNQELLAQVGCFRKCRNELVHEKAHLDTGEIKYAQEIAENAMDIMATISEHFENEKSGH